ncbi:hypothetical protein CDAR_569621 [Caerostris darwini]|uniref:Uncharacterized protein n=1 Tax=Caerostris darwini TaxID=1538125 RepID=A0AAV4S1A6_9ARAC|nr:hypothetical protein CDAR_569621 [Caerostris darwini]
MLAKRYMKTSKLMFSADDRSQYETYKSIIENNKRTTEACNFISDPTLEELDSAIHRLDPNKSPEPDVIFGQMITHFGENAKRENVRFLFKNSILPDKSKDSILPDKSKDSILPAKSKNEELQLLKDKRDRLRRKAEITGRISDVSNWRKHAAILKESIISAKRSCFDSFISKINFQRDSLKTYKFLAHLKNQTPHSTERPFRINQKIISSNAKVADYFLKYFTEANRKGAYARKMSRVLKRQLGHCRDRSEDLPENVKSIFCSSFSMHELNMALNGLKNHKSPGVDNIHPEFLKHLGQTVKVKLLKFFNIIWTTT